VFGSDGWDEAVDGPPPTAPDCYDEDAAGEWSIEELVAHDPERPRPVAEILAEAERGPVSVALAGELAAVDVDALDDDQRLAVAVAAGRCVNHYEAVRLRAVAAFAGPQPRDDTSAGAFAWCELGAVLTLGEGQARRQVHTAQRLASHLPGTFTAMLAGKVTLAKAHTLIDATEGLDVDQCAQVEARVLPHAADRNPASHTCAVGRAVRKVDPHGWAARREQKLADIAMIRYSQGDGIANILLRSVDGYDAELLWTAADTWARQHKAAGDPRTLDALRVAALITWAADYLTGTTGTGEAATPAPTRHGQPAVVNILIHLPDATDPAHGGAATIAGSGEPLPADAVADLLRDGARIRFALINPAGHLVGISTKTHDPTALQRVFVALRDVTVRVPNGSSAVVAGQDLDHIDPDGPTEPGNLHPPSRGWHRAKTFGHWSLTANPDGTITWTSTRTGRTYTTHPYDHRAGP
jgi:hypothetical protein